MSTQSSVVKADSESVGTEGEIRRWKLQIEALTKQRDAFATEMSRMQQRVDSSGGNAQKTAKLEQRFEAALQAVGKLQEDLEVVQAERDAFRKQIERDKLSQL